jgi:endonuclease YncB( thermonuclease family)
MQTAVFYFFLSLAIISLLLVPFGLAWSGMFGKMLGKKISRLRLFVILMIIFVLSFIIALLAEPEDPQTPVQKPSRPGYYKVAGVIDGDSLQVDIGGQIESVRLIGIDAPELPGGCFGLAAKSQAGRILSGKEVRLEPDTSQANRDTYGRLLRYVILPDGINFNRLMLAKGYAREFTFKSPYRYQSSFMLAEQTAKAHRAGLWSDTACGR